MNLLNQNQSNLSSVFESGFKYVKWNSNLDISLLCAITNCNQLILFDCSQLTAENTSNLLDSDSENRTASSENIFDIKSNSKYFNLTEFWLNTYNSNLIRFQAKTIEEFLANLNKITPTCAIWSSVFKFILNVNPIYFELLFVAFKSNQIGVFLLYKSRTTNKLVIKLYDLINVNEKINQENSSLQDEFIIVDLSKASSNTLITCLNFWSDASNESEPSYGLLEIGTSSGTILLARLSLNSKRIARLVDDANKETEMELTATEDNLVSIQSKSGKIFSLDLIQLSQNETFRSFLFVIRKENNLKFKILTYDFAKNEMSENGSLSVHLKENIDSTDTNFVIKNLFKLSNFKMIETRRLNESTFLFGFLLTYENSKLENFCLKIQKENASNYTLSQIDLPETQRFFKLKTSVATESKQGANDLLRVTQHSFLSSNNYIFYQINDFPQSMLVFKKSPQFQINVYRLKPSEKLVKQFMQNDRSRFNQNSESVQLSDFLWLIKYHLYLKQETFFDEATFDFLFKCIKSSQHFLNTPSLKKDNLDVDLDQIVANFKRLRILCLTLSEYFERLSSFDFENIRSKENEIESDDDPDTDEDSHEESNEEDESREMEEEPIRTETKSVTSIQKTDSTNIIKSSSYYRSMLREYTLNIFKFYSLDFISKALKIGIDHLSQHERLVLYFYSDFSLKKNFTFRNINQNTLEQIIKDNGKISKKFNLFALLKMLKCDLCGNNFDIEKCSELNSLKCQFGHSVSRCQKSLLPLSNFCYSKCRMCNFTWNNFDADDFPNISTLVQNQNRCLYCN